MKEKTIWISFDMSFRADYEGLYKWLDKLDAEECGKFLAVLKYKANGDFIGEIERDVKLHVKLEDGDRIYVLYRDDETGKVMGRFIKGGRKMPSWNGYCRPDQSEIIDGQE